MHLKHIVSLLAALLLAAALALPVFAAPEDEIITATDAYAETQAEGTTAFPEISGAADAPSTEIATQTTPIMPYQAEEGTHPEIMPVNDGALLMGPEDAGLFSQRNLTFAALCLSGLAVLLSIIALLRSRKRTAPNATGNYQKYF